LRQSASGRQGHCRNKPGDGEVAQNRVLKLKHTTTHKFPDCCLPVASPDPYLGWFDAVQMGLQCGGDIGGFP
jgi:hypothetical protein